jgi:capsular polysaccharide biosynthesis protein
MLVFAVLPLKGLNKFAPTTNKFFGPLLSRGITKADFDGLIQALSRSELNDLSTPAQWLRWYNKQPENYRIIFNQISKGDKATWQSIAKEIAKMTSKKVTGEGSETLIKALSGSNEKIVELFGKAVKFTPTTLPLYKDAIKVTLAQYGGFIGLYFLTELFLGWKLNNPEPTKWVGEFVNLPTEADLLLNILNAGSSENAQKMIDSLHANPQYQKVTDFITNQSNMDEGVDKAEDIMDSLLQKTYVDTTGLPYVREETKSTFVEVNISDQDIPQDGCWILYDANNPSEEAKTEMDKIQKLDNSTYKWSKGNMYIKKQNCKK